MKQNGRPIRLIELSTALADDRPASDLSEWGMAGAKTGFRFRALRFADEETPDRRRWAFSCHPEDYGFGIRGAYILSHLGVLYKKDLGHGNGIDVWPHDPDAEGWERLD